MKTLVLGVGAFGYAILNYLAKIHPDQTFYGYEKDQISNEYLQKVRSHPHFFRGTSLLQNVEIITDPISILGSVELLIIAIPNQFIEASFREITSHIPGGITILNLSKGINNSTLETVSMTLKNTLKSISYTYSVLSGGMIASELVEGKMLGAQIGCSEHEKGKMLEDFLGSETLAITLTSKYKNIELYGALKNIFALYMGYLEGKGNGLSTVGYHFCELYKDIMKLIVLLGGDNVDDFSQYALGGDLIATCFGNSRNRYFGRLVGEGKSSQEAYDTLKGEKKHAEGFETLKGVKKFLEGKERLPELQKVIDIFL